MALRSVLARLIRPVVWFHLGVWGLFFLPTIVSYHSEYGLRSALLLEGFYLAYFALPVYFHQLVLWPRLQRPGRRWLYGLLVALLPLAYAGLGRWLIVAVLGWEDSFLRLATRIYFLGFIFALIAAYFDSQARQRRLQQLEHQQTHMELSLLKAQVNPHFLFNTLHNLYALTLSNSPESPRVVLQLAELMRYMFTAANLEMVPLDQEVQHLRHYVELERLRLSQRAVIGFNVQGSFGLRQLPPMLLIPFVENAFKHGVETATGRVFVTIDLALQGNELFFVVENSKPAHPPAAEAGGTGLPNVRKRLQLLYPGRHTLTLDDEPATYRATLSLAL